MPHPHFFGLSFRKQGALFFLLLLIFLATSYLFYKPSSQEPRVKIETYSVFQKEWDSLMHEEKKERSRITTFNPNFLTDYRAYTLGISLEAADRLKAFRAGGGFVNSARAFQEVTQIPDSTLRRIQPYFKFPEFQKRALVQKVTPKVKKEINAATAEDLEAVRGIGKVLAERILKYRNLLQGFSTLEQCYEVYGLDSLVVKRLLEQFTLTEPPFIKKVAIQTISLEELAKLPHINYDEARKIIALRTRTRNITVEEAAKVIHDSQKKLNRLKLYLY